jgi:hypothetical protein
MIESAQTTLEGIKENSQSSKVPKQSLEAWRKIQRIQKFWAKKKNQYNDAQNQMKNNKNKGKEPKPNNRGHDRPFWKDIPKTKGQQTSTSDP